MSSFKWCHLVTVTSQFFIYNPNNNIIFYYYLEADDVSATYVKVMTSSNGVNWTSPTTIFTTRPNERYGILSPAAVYNNVDDKYYMWYVNAGNLGHVNQSNTIELRTSNGGAWSDPVTCNFPASSMGITPWHIDVIYVPEKNEYWMVYCGYPIGGSSSSNMKLYFAKSTDRVNWSIDSTPILN